MYTPPGTSLPSSHHTPLGRHGAPIRAPCATQQLRTSNLLYTWKYQ